MTGIPVGLKAGYAVEGPVPAAALAALADFAEFSLSGPGPLPDPASYALDLPVLSVHAPHFSSHGCNPCDPREEARSLGLLAAASAAADALGASVIVVHPERVTHPGCSRGQLVRVLRFWGDPRAAVENMPCPGFVVGLPEEAAAVMAATGCGLVLDVAHAACLAHALGLDQRRHLEGLLALGPVLAHASDTYLACGTGPYADGTGPAAPGPWCEDLHLPLGGGDMDWGLIGGLLPAGLPVTLETPPTATWAADAELLRARGRIGKA